MRKFELNLKIRFGDCSLLTWQWSSKFQRRIITPWPPKININFVRSTQFDVHSLLCLCDDSCFNSRPNSGNSKLRLDSEQIVGLVCSVNSSRVGLKPTKCLAKVRRDTEDSAYNMVIFTGGNLFIQFIKLLKQPLRHRTFTVLALQALVSSYGKIFWELYALSG